MLVDHQVTPISLLSISLNKFLLYIPLFTSARLTLVGLFIGNIAAGLTQSKAADVLGGATNSESLHSFVDRLQKS